MTRVKYSLENDLNNMFCSFKIRVKGVVVWFLNP
jgi:hypothetical protein